MFSKFSSTGNIYPGNGLNANPAETLNVTACDQYGNYDLSGNVNIHGTLVKLNPTGLGSEINNTAIGVVGADAGKFTTLRSTQTLDVSGNLAIGTTTGKFTVESTTGNTNIVGTLDVGGGFTVNNTGITHLKNKLQCDQTATFESGPTKFIIGITDTTPTIITTMPLTIRDTSDTNKFTVASDTGNTVVAGTLTVASDKESELGGVVRVKGSIDTIYVTGTNALDLGAGTANAVNISRSGIMTTVKGTLTVTGATALNGDVTIANNKTLTSDIVDINGGAIDDTTIGASGVSTGGFTAVTINPNNVAGAALLISNSAIQQEGTDLVRITGQQYSSSSVINALNVAAGDVHIEDRLNVNDDVTIYGKWRLMVMLE